MPTAAPDAYHLKTLWQFEEPINVVWDAIADAERWPIWWKGIESVETLDCGEANGLGARRCYTCRSVLPMRLTFVGRVTRVVPMHLIEGLVEGELQGIGCCRLERSDGLTVVHYDWQVRTTTRWMKLLAPLAKPLFRWNHDQIMRAGGIGLARHLNARPESGADRIP